MIGSRDRRRRGPICDTHRAAVAREDCAILYTLPYYYGQSRLLRRFDQNRVNALFNEP
jgi:hypothetical protein